MADATSNLILFLLSWNLGGAISIYIYLSVKQPSVLKEKKYIARQMLEPRPLKHFLLPFGRSSIWSLFHAINISLFALATRYIDPSAAAILLEAWPILFVLLMHDAGYMAQEGNVRNTRHFLYKKDIFFMLLGFLGVIFVVLAETTSKSGSGGGINLMWGLMLMGIVVLFSLQSTVQFSQASSISQNSNVKLEPLHAFIFIRLIMHLAISVFGGVIFTLLYFAGTNNYLVSSFSFRVAILGFLCGGIISLFGSLTNGSGTLGGKNLGVQAVRYSTPIFGVLFLFSFAFLGDHFDGLKGKFPGASDINPFFLAFGLAIIVSANLSIHLRGSKKSINQPHKP